MTLKSNIKIPLVSAIVLVILLTSFNSSMAQLTIPANPGVGITNVWPNSQQIKDWINNLFTGKDDSQGDNEENQGIESKEDLTEYQPHNPLGKYNLPSITNEEDCLGEAITYWDDPCNDYMD